MIFKLQLQIADYETYSRRPKRSDTLLTFKRSLVSIYKACRPVFPKSGLEFTIPGSSCTKPAKVAWASNHQTKRKKYPTAAEYGSCVRWLALPNERLVTSYRRGPLENNGFKRLMEHNLGCKIPSFAQAVHGLSRVSSFQAPLARTLSEFFVPR